MGVAVRRPPASPDRVTCPFCGTEQERPDSAASAACAICSKLLPTDASPAPQEGSEPHQASPPALRAVRSASSDSTRRAISDIVSQGPQNEAPRLIGDLVSEAKRLGSILSLIPFIGPRLIRESDLHTGKEKATLALLSMALTAFVLLGVVLLVPTPAERVDRTHARMHSEITTLAAFAERYRSENGAYPPPQVWARYAERADPRFYDPWGRPYRVELKADGFTLSTLGRDGTLGGASEDADIERHFSSAASPG